MKEFDQLGQVIGVVAQSASLWGGHRSAIPAEAIEDHLVMASQSKCQRN
jgi:hypothetical protein